MARALAGKEYENHCCPGPCGLGSLSVFPWDASDFARVLRSRRLYQNMKISTRTKSRDTPRSIPNPSTMFLLLFGDGLGSGEFVVVDEDGVDVATWPITVTVVGNAGDTRQIQIADNLAA